jgi:hypothetical protein
MGDIPRTPGRQNVNGTAGVPHQQRHSPGTAAFIAGSANLIARRDNRDDLLLGVGHDVVGLDHSWPL